jgi:hypothetical protein
MQQWNDFNRQQEAIQKQLEKRDSECVSCPKCSSQWFEEVEVSRYKSDHNIVLGQKVPAKPGTIPYILLRCVTCTDLLEPRVLHNTRDVVGGDYNHFLDTVEGKEDSRVKRKPNNEIPSQEL